MSGISNRVIIYINGVLFHPRAVNITASQGGYVSFSVDLPAVKEWTILQKRSHAAVFFVDPVTRAWRFLCEGEYTGKSYSKTGEGNRSLQLAFDGIHAAWQRTKYTNLVGVLTSGVASASQSQSPGSVILAAKANGRNIDSIEDAEFGISDLNSMIESTTTEGTRISAFLPNFVKVASQQTPVDAYYMAARRWTRKMYAPPDDEIKNLIDYRRAQDVIFNGPNSFGLGPNATLDQIIRTYEDLAMYQHTPVLSPPMYGASSPVPVIPETMFIPHLYHVVPPASNVVFRDQVSTISETRDFTKEPTRVVAQLESTIDISIPKYYMANSRGGVDVIAAASTSGIRAGGAVTHDFLSSEEMEMGVIPEVVGVGLEKVSNPDTGNGEASPTLENYMDQAAKHHFEVSRARAYRKSVMCTFLPYVVVGFPCLIEDASGPFFGIVESVQHQLPSTDNPSTLLTVSHVRDAYIQDEKNRTPYPPTWLNAKFRVSQVSKTYDELFGRNAFSSSGFSAMLPDRDLVSTDPDLDDVFSSYLALERPNLDELAAKVIPVPRYSADLSQIIDDNQKPIADVIRSTSPNPNRRFLEYQYRAGVTLTEYSEFHNLRTQLTLETDSADTRPPDDLSIGRGQLGGDPLFGSPYALTFVGPDQLTNPRYLNALRPGVFEDQAVGEDELLRSYDTALFGLYAPISGPAGLISDERQNAARMIRVAIEKGATRD